VHETSGCNEAISYLEGRLVARLLPAWNEINRFRLRAYEVSLRSTLISDVDRRKNVSSSSAPSELSIDGSEPRRAVFSPQPNVP